MPVLKPPKLSQKKIKSKIKEVREEINKKLDELEVSLMSQPVGPGQPPPPPDDDEKD